MNSNVMAINIYIKTTILLGTRIQRQVKIKNNAVLRQQKLYL
jgi:hypothetical protein